MKSFKIAALALCLNVPTIHANDDCPSRETVIEFALAGLIGMSILLVEGARHAMHASDYKEQLENSALSHDLRDRIELDKELADIDTAMNRIAAGLVCVTSLMPLLVCEVWNTNH